MVTDRGENFMKRYVLGDYELDCPEIHLLRRAIETHIHQNEKFIGVTTEKLAQFYKDENEKLFLMLDQLERYGK